MCRNPSTVVPAIAESGSQILGGRFFLRPEADREGGEEEEGGSGGGSCDCGRGRGDGEDGVGRGRVGEGERAVRFLTSFFLPFFLLTNTPIYFFSMLTLLTLLGRLSDEADEDNNIDGGGAAVDGEDGVGMDMKLPGGGVTSRRNRASSRRAAYSSPRTHRESSRGTYLVRRRSSASSPTSSCESTLISVSRISPPGQFPWACAAAAAAVILVDGPMGDLKLSLDRGPRLLFGREIGSVAIENGYASDIGDRSEWIKVG